MACAPKIRPHTKHINIKYHHFLSFVTAGLLSLYAVTSEEQFADIFTKTIGRYPIYETP
jgi:hypothetical protein